MSSDLLQQLLENLPDLVVRIRVKPEVGFDYVSPGVYELLGYTPEEFYGQPELVFETVHHDDRPLVGKALAAPGREAFIARMIHKDGRTVWLECRSVGVWDESGELVAIEGISRDVTDRMLAEREAAETEARLRLALDHARMLVWDHDLDTDELKLRAGEQGWAFGPDEPRTLSQLVERVHPEDRQTLTASLEKLVSRGEVDFEMRFLHPDGGEVWAENRIRLIAHGDGGLGTATGTTLDITARKRAEEEIRAAHAGLAAIVSASPIAITATDSSLRATLWSPAAERLYGWASDEVIGRPLPTVPPEQLEEMQRLVERVFAGSAVPEFETQRLRKDGTRVDVAIGLAPLLDARGNVTGVLGTGVEITQQATHRLLEHSFAALQRVDTERRRLLERLVHAQEEERARIGADIHDDFRAGVDRARPSPGSALRPAGRPATSCVGRRARAGRALLDRATARSALRAAAARARP